METVFEFGDAKLKLFDIDPLYFAVVRSKLSLSTRQRYTLAEVAFDLAGVAARIAEAKDFWKAFRAAAADTPRGAPRRYFRGQVALEATDQLRNRFGTPEACIASLQGSFREVHKTICKTFPQFGPCAAFKLADMAERVCGNRIDFSALTPEEICNSKQVQKGFDKACVGLKCTPAALIPKMQSRKWATLAPPHFDRPLNGQEFETILCYYSHEETHSKHRPGMDVEGIRKELRGFGPLAERLERNLP